ncbi:MAG: TraR/DksA C4-type zinc finger protein [Actinomycetota bacterium]
METQTLGYFRERLEEERKSLRKQLEEIGADPDEPSVDRLDIEAGFADAGQSSAERANALALIERVRGALAEVDTALGKFDLGAFGVCEGCGQAIPGERLEAIPSARLCVGCKNR